MTDDAAGCTDQCRQITAAHDSERKRALAERERLRATLAEVLGQFQYKTNPGRPCRQSGHVAVETLAKWHAALAPEPAVDAGTGDATTEAGAPECASCGETEAEPYECPNSRRPCGHHCNHVWVHDVCDWCGVEIGADLTTPTETKD